MVQNPRNRGGYGQYCPLAIAAETLGGRWTILILSRVIEGCASYSAIADGVPKISPALLSTRLNELVAADLVTRKKDENGRFRYRPTQSALELEPLLDSLAQWGQRWARDMVDEDLDPAFLAWSMHLRMDANAMPAGRTVLQFDFDGAPANCRRFWLVSESGAIDMCLKPPGFETDLYVKANLRIFIEAWRGIRDLRAELRAERIKISGPPALIKSFPDWLLLSQFAPIKRQRSGKEARTQSASHESSAKPA
ncbi:MAG: helix-turn-helix domain-containing protein [Parvularculaceae bacterium]